MKSGAAKISDKSVITEKTRKDKISVFTICLIIAVLIWLLIKLSEDHTTTIEYPIASVNLSADKVMVDKSDSMVVLRVKAHGFKLISVKYFQKRYPIVVDFKKLKPKKITAHSYESCIVASQILSEISSQLKYSNELLSISPDTLFLELEDFIQKKIPIRLNLDVNFEKQHHLYSPIKYFPNSVVVKGPYSVISKLEYVQTERIELNNLKDDITFSVDIQKPFNNSLVTLSGTEINVELDVEEFTEANFDIALDFTPIDSGMVNKELRIKTFPEKVNVVFMVALKDYKSIKEDIPTTFPSLKRSISSGS